MNVIYSWSPQNEKLNENARNSPPVVMNLGSNLYMELNTEIFHRLDNIHWFENCAKPPDEAAGLDVIWVSDWQTATKYFSDPEWENTTLEAQNALTTYLSKRHPIEYQCWNKLVREAKQKLATVYRTGEVFREEKGLDKTFEHCFKWDILAIVMEQTYKSICPHVFSSKMLRVYESRRFPCGWKGEWPNGRLVVI